MKTVISLNGHSQRLTAVAENFPKIFSSPQIFVKSVDNSWKEMVSRPSLGIVGTRHPTPYGTRILRRIIKALKDLPINIVSGGAMGIDCIAHEEALRWGLPTQAWVVGPIDHPSPHSNSRLFRNLNNTSGCALFTPSQLEPKINSKIMKHYWLSRNAWLAAACDCILVIEAFEKSGTWSTVKAASCFNLDTYALPGPVDSPQSAGTNSMIARGYANLMDLSQILINSLLVECRSDSYNLNRGLYFEGGLGLAKSVAKTSLDSRLIEENVDPDELLSSSDGVKKLDELLSREDVGFGAGRLFRRE